MKHISIFVLAVVTLAAATPYPSDSKEVASDAKVVIHTTPTQVTVTGAIPIPISEVLKAAKIQELKAAEEIETPMAEDREDIIGDEKKIEKRWGKKEEEGHGWLPSLPSLFGWSPSPPAPTTPAPAIVGPFAFQLGAYYNPLIPAVVESSPAYPRYPSSSRPAYNPPNTYASSPSYSNPSSYAPASSSYSAAPSYSSSSSYSAPSTYSSSPSSSYPSSSYTPPASYSPPSYSAPSSYSSPATYGNPPY